MIEEHKQADVEALRHKPGVLRAKDIIPGEAPAAVPNHTFQDAVAREIPRFNLADDIMAEHRKITAIRRKGPGIKWDVESGEVGEEQAWPAGDGPAASAVERDEIIAEIVARDIERLCRAQ
jgi:hypothetical protein